MNLSNPKVFIYLKSSMFFLRGVSFFKLRASFKAISLKVSQAVENSPSDYCFMGT